MVQESRSGSLLTPFTFIFLLVGDAGEKGNNRGPSHSVDGSVVAVRSRRWLSSQKKRNPDPVIDRPPNGSSRVRRWPNYDPPRDGGPYPVFAVLLYWPRKLVQETR